MKFDINIWTEYRQRAGIIGRHITSFKHHKGFIQLDKEELDSFVEQITAILKECSEYMDKCNLKIKAPLWEYHNKKTRTHASSKDFIYKDRMSPKLIKSYGENFMSLDLDEKSA